MNQSNQLDQSEAGKKTYQELVKQHSPNSHLAKDCLRAFLVGGAICTVGQVIMNWLAYAGFSRDERGLYTSIILICVASLLTGLGVYGKLGKFAGAGSIVPITGFSNAITAPAIEFKKEGFILGVGAKMFVIAGPVIVYGVVTSVAVGVVYYLLT